jgi:hypothetical protein
VDILPPEITVFIFSNVPLRDIGRIAVSCKTWNNYVNEEATWKQIYELKYDTSQINNSLHQTLSWRRLVSGFLLQAMHNLTCRFSSMARGVLQSGAKSKIQARKSDPATNKE